MNIINFFFFIIAIVSLLMVYYMNIYSGELCKEYCNITGSSYYFYSIGNCRCEFRPSFSKKNVTINITLNLSVNH